VGTGVAWQRELVLLRALTDSPIATGIVDAQGRFLFVNRAFCDVLELTEEQALASEGLGLTHPDAIEPSLGGADATGTAPSRVIRRFLRPDGAEVIADVALTFVRDDHNVVGYVIVQLVDITARNLDMAALRVLADTDPLTGLLNRRALSERITSIPVREQREGPLTAVIYCDLDGLTRINDLHGHHVGDALLQAVARRIAAAVRSGDLVARVGGDEFVVVLGGVRGDDAAIQVAHKIAERVSQPILIEGTRFQPTLSIGIALTDDVTDLEGTMRRADMSLYEMKLRRTTAQA
jgi:diguanylate cyclase (GGDEF)-like protein/PAS domain S-box-containing protein